MVFFPKRKLWILNICLWALFHSVFGLSETSDLQIFYRCYSQLTQSYPMPNDQNLIKIEAGELDPIEACMSMLNAVEMTSTDGNIYTLKDQSQPLNIKIANTFHDLHYSWFSVRQFGAMNQLERGTRDTLDHMGQAIYITKSLFVKDMPFKEIFTGAKNVLARRSIAQKVNGTFPVRSPYSNLPASVFPLARQVPNDFNFAPQGDLLGVEFINNKTINFLDDARLERPAGQIDFGLHYGGGVLGSMVYILQTVQEGSPYYKSNAFRTPRRWARSIFSDFMCRDLPVVRENEDAAKDPTTSESFVDSNSTMSFRLSTGCTQCHVSMDRMSFALRNYQVNGFGAELLENIIGSFLFKYPTTLPAASIWPATPDEQFHLRPPEGYLYIRSWDGKLINKKVIGVEELGKAISEIDEPYICAASRYFEYFTGIKAEIDDVEVYKNSPLSKEQAEIRKFVVKLGLDLKSNPQQDLKLLIDEILRSPYYKTSIH